MISSMFISWMKWKTILSRHVLRIVYLKRMLVSAPACAPANCVLNETSPGMVSFFIDCSIREFFFYENNFPDLDKRQNAKILPVKKSGYTVIVFVCGNGFMDFYCTIEVLT